MWTLLLILSIPLYLMGLFGLLVCIVKRDRLAAALFFAGPASLLIAGILRLRYPEWFPRRVDDFRASWRFLAGSLLAFAAGLPMVVYWALD